MHDDFSSANSGWTNGKASIDEDWGNGVIHRYGYDLENRRYFIDVFNSAYFVSYWWNTGLEASEFQNIILEVVIEGPLNDDGAYAQGIAFGHRGKGIPYTFDLTSDGLCRLVQKLPGQELYSVAKEHQIVNFDSKIAHTLRVEIAGQNFTGYIDGVHCLEDTLEGYQTGNIGLVGRPPNDNEGNNRFFFKDFKIFKLSP